MNGWAYIINKVDPRGTPEFIVQEKERVPKTLTEAFLLIKYP
jgi:hypothetical protein